MQDQKACHSSLGKRRDWSVGRPSRSTEKFWTLIGHLEEAADCLPLETNINPREGRDVLLPIWQMYWLVRSWDLVVLEATWQMATSAPHVGSRREPEAGGWPGASCAAWMTTQQPPTDPKRQYFKWEKELWVLPSLLVWLREVGLSSWFPREVGFGTRVCHFPR